MFLAGGGQDPKKPHETTPRFIGSFTTASQEHYHDVNGVRGDESA